MLIPDSGSLLLGLGLAVLGLWGLIRVGRIALFMRRPDHTVALYNWFTHVIFPGSSYLLFALAAFSLLFSRGSFSLLAVAFGATILLISAIWHSWELILWVARQPRN
jgi:hypothetical protein